MLSWYSSSKSAQTKALRGHGGGITTPVATTNCDNYDGSSLSVICLGNPKVNGKSITEIDKAKTKLTRVCEVPLTGRAPLR